MTHMDTVLVTGGTGFIGAHVVRAILDAGVKRLRCLVRRTSRLTALDGLDVELFEGDLADRSSLLRAARGAELVFHCAADYRLYARDPRELYRTNVEGTDNLLSAAFEAGTARVVYTSTVGALRTSLDGRAAREEDRLERTEARRAGHYKGSKRLAEEVVDAWIARGLDVVTVLPSTPVGELDLKPTPTGAIIEDFLRGRMFAFVDTGLNVVDVRDVAAGHVLAAQKGGPGSRYILGHQNITLEALFRMLGAITGLPAPTLRLPGWAPVLLAYAATAVARLSGGVPRVSLEAARLARSEMYFDAGKAVTELGLPQSPIEGALTRAAEWFRRRGRRRG